MKRPPFKVTTIRADVSAEQYVGCLVLMIVCNIFFTMSFISLDANFRSGEVEGRAILLFSLMVLVYWLWINTRHNSLNFLPRNHAEWAATIGFVKLGLFISVMVEMFSGIQMLLSFLNSVM